MRTDRGSGESRDYLPRHAPIRPRDAQPFVQHSHDRCAKRQRVDGYTPGHHPVLLKHHRQSCDGERKEHEDGGAQSEHGNGARERWEVQRRRRSVFEEIVIAVARAQILPAHEMPERRATPTRRSGLRRTWTRCCNRCVSSPFYHRRFPPAELDVRHTSLYVCALALAVSMPQAGRAQQGRSSSASKVDPALAAQAKISLDSARTIALHKVKNGQVAAEELERENGRLIYSFDVKVAGKSGIVEVNVNALNGAVVGVHHESVAAEAREARADSAAARKAARTAVKPPG